MTDDLSSAPVHEVPSTAGQWLRQARTRQGLHLAMLSVALKVPVRTLELLEADRFEELPGPTFVRGLASSVCRHLRLDPAEVLALLPQREQRMAAAPASLAAAPIRSSSRRWFPERSQSVYMVLALGMVLLIAGLLWWPASSSPSVTEPAISFMPPPEALAPQASSPEAVAVPATPGPGAVAVEAAPVAPPASAGREPAVLALPAPAAVSSSPSAPLLRLTASGESWVEVRSAQDQVVFSQVLQAGQEHEIRHPGPLKVVLGRAAVMQVQVKGQNFELAPHTKVTVARFEVGP